MIKDMLVSGTKWSDGFKAFQCGSCVRIFTHEMLMMRKGEPNEKGEYTCPHCGIVVAIDPQTRLI